MKNIIPIAASFLLLSIIFFSGCAATAKTANSNPVLSLEEKKAEAVSYLSSRYGKSGEPSFEVLVDVNSMKQTKKAIYRDAKDGMFLVKWPDLLVIYDYDSNTIVKELAIASMQAG